MDGLSYSLAVWRDTRIHTLAIDLAHRTIRPVMGAEAFPFQRVYPIYDAIEQGAAACVGDGFNTTWLHGLGVVDQPLHALVVNREIWTSGNAAGGYGFLIGRHHASTRQNRIEVHVWRPDHTAIEVEHVNRGNDGKVVAFTPRGGTNEHPREGKHYAVLGEALKWQDEGDTMHRLMTVLDVTTLTPPAVEPDTVVLEGRWPLKLTVGDEVTWTQRLGAPGVRHIISGATGIIENGANRVPNLHLLAQAPLGPDNWYVRRNPRTVLGHSEDGKTAYIVVVEGRIPTSRGMRLKELAAFLVDQGMAGAVNMDGGGSSFLVVDGKLVSDSCYGDGTLEGLRPDQYSTAVF